MANRSSENKNEGAFLSKSLERGEKEARDEDRGAGNGGIESLNPLVDAQISDYVDKNGPDESQI